MKDLIILLIVALIIGLFFRSKGDGLLDTIGHGCSAIWGCAIFVVIAIVIILVMAG
jgi:hypothetical protein